MEAEARPTVLLWPVKFGFGPVGKALHLARGLRQAYADALRLVLVAPASWAVPAEPSLLDEITENPSSASAIVSIMSREAVSYAAGIGVPSLVVDSLAWFWDEPLDFFRDADVYAYQELPLLPVPERNLAGIPSPRRLGAIGGSLPGRATGSRDGLVVSLSGLAGFDFDLDQDPFWYASGWLRRMAGLGRMNSDPMEVWGNPAVLERFRNLSGPEIVLGSGRQSAFLDRCAAAKGVIVAPGLTTIVELCLGRTQVGLLPPQNYSQVKIASAAARAGIPVLGWPQRDIFEWLARASLPERVGGSIVRALIAENYLIDSGFRQLDLEGLVATTLRPAEYEVRDIIGDEEGTAALAEMVMDLVGGSPGRT